MTMAVNLKEEQQTIYKIQMWGGNDNRYRLYDTKDEALAAAYGMRKENRGHFLYEATGKQMKLIRAWEASRA